MLQFNEVAKNYGSGIEALRPTSFNIDKGEMVFITGRSGAGKTTLLKLIPRLETVSRGQIVVNGQNINRLSAAQIPLLRRHLGLVFQDPKLLSDRSVFDNVALPLVICGLSVQDISKRTQAALDKVGLLSKQKLSPMALSMGEQQRLSIARAIVNKPSILIADEPTGNLDPQLAAQTMRLLEQFSEVGVTVLVASHDIHLISKMKKRVLTLKEGYLVSDGMGVSL